MRVESLQSCLILGDPMDNSLPGSSVHGILLARILEWVAMPPSEGSSQRSSLHLLCLLHWQEGSLPQVPPGKPVVVGVVGQLLLQFGGNISVYRRYQNPETPAC